MVETITCGLHEDRREPTLNEEEARISNLPPADGVVTDGQQGAPSQSGGLDAVIKVLDKAVVGSIETALDPERNRQSGLSKDQVVQNPEKNLAASASHPDDMPLAVPQAVAVDGQSLELVPLGDTDSLR